MARRDVLYLLCLLFLANNYVRYSSCSLHDKPYDEYGLESERFCHKLNKKSTIEIKNSAAIVWPKHMFDRWSVLTDVRCKFVFKAAKGDGLFGVIQEMSLRQNSTDCIDYVQFKRKDNHRTQKFCGMMDRSKIKYYTVPEPEHNFYMPGATHQTAWNFAEYDPSESKSGGELETEIFISKEKLMDGEFLALKIVYTPYKNCSNVDFAEYTSIRMNACLRNEFFCDRIYNCAPGVCSDEDNCPNTSTEITSTGTGTKVTVGAVTTLILCFIIFVMCLWICKRSQKLCWSLECVDPNVCSSRPGQLPHELEGSANPPVPTAPMLEVAVCPSMPDKDLPPSYDSLFPEQSNPVRS
ncbi:uncharacterized protein LOC128890031 [Hylaeus anthracinus]|uniref:uncharacterized protein LOC128890031 n=1 Tax=Hylaeus anthracinus TaxID=313031 RepID=UPI0023B9D824|nr:uncharacterized protein LOC128890031 [Hylaeus anthracinus]